MEKMCINKKEMSGAAKKIKLLQNAQESKTISDIMFNKQTKLEPASKQ